MSRLWRIIVAAFASLGLFVVLVSFTPFVTWYGGKLGCSWNDAKGDVLIVLGAGSFGDGFPAESSVLRSLYAVRAYQTARFRKVVLSGWAVSDHMRRILMAEGVPAEAIVIENASKSTRENALYTAQMLAGEPGSKLLLTSDYHMFRALRCFRKVGMSITPLPIPDARKRAARIPLRWPAFLDEMGESVKIVYYFARGWI